MADFRGDYEATEVVPEDALIFIKLRGMNHNKPMLGNYIGRRGNEVMVHVTDGPANKKGQNVWFPAKYLTPHKVSSLALRASFKGGRLPEALSANNGAFVLTDDDHNNYPDFSKNPISLDGSVRDPADIDQVKRAKEKLGLGRIAQQPAFDNEDMGDTKLRQNWGIGNETKPSFSAEDPNIAMARDFLRSGNSTRRGRGQSPVPMRMGIRRRSEI